MHIHSLSLERAETGTWRLAATIADQEIWYEIEGSPQEPLFSYDPFVLAGFFLAMDRGEDIEVAGDAPVSGALIENLEQAAHVSKHWWPYLEGGVIRAENVAEDAGKGLDQVGSFFSGGADSLFTYLKNASEITHLILCWGLDIADYEPERWKKTRDHVKAFAEQEGKDLILVRSNMKMPMLAPGAAENHGALLASTGIPLGFGTLLVPATNPIHRLQPHGTHPFLDPHFSNGRTTIIHDSPVRRSEKLTAIAETGMGLEFLRVCNREADYNCGICEKCLRTRAALNILGAESPALEPMSQASDLRSLTLQKAIEYDYWVDNLAFAERHGRADFVREIQRLLRNWRMRETLRQLDADWLGGALIKMKRRLRRGG